MQLLHRLDQYCRTNFLVAGSLNETKIVIANKTYVHSDDVICALQLDD